MGVEASGFGACFVERGPDIKESMKGDMYHDILRGKTPYFSQRNEYGTGLGLPA